MGLSLVQFLVAHAPLIVFSAAQPGQMGSGHINEQPKSYWIERFEAAGANYLEDASRGLSGAFARAGVSTWFERNVLVFEVRT